MMMHGSASYLCTSWRFSLLPVFAVFPSKNWGERRAEPVLGLQFSAQFLGQRAIFYAHKRTDEWRFMADVKGRESITAGRISPDGGLGVASHSAVCPVPCASSGRA
ncbi:hypothetical protein DFH06DRAFT_1228146 [Mycena polygramma]|nr:hypothetical protein DFH06DRAFT_1228146 [Mycena polygramma]